MSKASELVNLLESDGDVKSSVLDNPPSQQAEIEKKVMKVLFVMPLAYSVYPFQLAALSSYMKKLGHSCEYLELVLGNVDDLPDMAITKVEEKIKDFNPDLVAFSSYDMTTNWIIQISKVIKAKQNVPILVGGYTATLAPQTYYDIPEIDYIGIGEGEYIMEELLRRLEAKEECHDIPGIYARKEGVFQENPVKYLIEDLDELPFPDREIFDHQAHIGDPDDGGEVFLAIMASKGCPYKCSYCANEFIKAKYENYKKYVRFRDPELVCDEIEEAAKKYRFNKVSFEDDMFTANPTWLRNFGEVYKRRIGLPFRCNIRPETSTDKNCKLLADMGCELVSIGVETGDREMRKIVLSRNMSDDCLLNAGKFLKKYNIKLRTFNLVGLPNETYYTLFKTIWMNFRLSPYEVQTSIFYPIMGTGLGDQCFEDGIVDIEKFKKIKEYAYETCLTNSKVPNTIIVASKWINSGVGILGGPFNVFRAIFVLIKNKLSIQRQWVSNLPRKKERVTPIS